MINLRVVWYRAGIELATPGSAVRHASVARHVTDCATRPGRNPCSNREIRVLFEHGFYLKTPKLGPDLYA